jgi:hypothetical protein
MSEDQTHWCVLQDGVVISRAPQLAQLLRTVTAGNCGATPAAADVGAATGASADEAAEEQLKTLRLNLEALLADLIRQNAGFDRGRLDDAYRRLKEQRAAHQDSH